MPRLLITGSRLLVAALFVLAGWNHFRVPATYVRITPPVFPQRLALVYVSGLCEIVGGIGLLIPVLRLPAAWGLIALLIAVFPANLYMAIAPEKFADLHLPTWMYWARLPLQPLLIAIIWLLRK